MTPYFLLMIGIFCVLLSCFFVANGLVLWFCCAQYLLLRDTSDMKSFIQLRNLGLLFLSLCSISFLSPGIYTIIAVIWSRHDNDFEYVMIELSNISIYTSITIHSFFLMTRLFQTFNETAYRITNKTMKIMVGWTIVLLLLFSVRLPAYVFYVFSNKEFVDIVITNVDYILWISVGLQQIYISHLFSSKLFAITLHIRKTRLSTAHHQILNQRQTSLLRVIAKQTLLSRIESSFLALVVVFKVLSVIKSDIEIVEILSVVFITLYFICLSITIQLSFVYSDKYYYRCCSSCHQFCMDYYQRKTIKTLKSSTKYQKNWNSSKLQQKSSQENTIEMNIKTESKQFEYVALNDSHTIDH